MLKLLQRILFYSLLLVVPPIILGASVLFRTMSRIMTYDTPAPLPSTVETMLIEKPKARFRALFVLGSNGTEVSDLLATYEVLSESRLFETRTAAPTTALVPTTGNLAIVPDYSYKDAPPADVLIIPGVITRAEKELIDWIGIRAREAQLIVTLSDGAKLAARAGLLRERTATGHFLSAEELEALEPKAEWVWGRKTVADGKIISSPGISASIDTALYVIQRMGGKEEADRTARELSYAWKPEPEALPASPVRPARLDARDLATLFLRGGYDWSKRQVGMILFQGISEIGLGAVMEVLPRTIGANVFTLAAERKPIATRHGLQVVPTETISTAGNPDLLVIASGLGPHGTPPEIDPLQDQRLALWIKDRNILLKNLLFDLPGHGFAAALDLVSQIYGSARLRQLIEKLIIYAPASRDATQLATSGASDSENGLIYYPLLVGMGCVAIAAFFDFRVSRRRKVLQRLQAKTSGSPA